MTRSSDFIWDVQINLTDATPNLQRLDVHIWYVPDLPDTSQLHAFLPLLSPRERRQAQSYYTVHDMSHFVVRRSILRLLLARYLHCSPDQLTYQIGLHGKLQLTDMDQLSPIQFNLAHSHNSLLYAFTRHRRVGIDLESQDALTDTIQYVTRFFTCREQQFLQSLPLECQPAAILNCWTRKEAYVKAIGDGLTHGLKHFEVSVLPNEPAQLLEIRGSREAAMNWTMVSLPMPSGYHATLVVEGQGWTPFYFQLETDSLMGSS